MEFSNNIILNRFFSKGTFCNLLDNQYDRTYYSVIKRYLDSPESKNNQEIISKIYHVMKKTYRNEYFYKNTILNKLLLGRHSLQTTAALAEIPIAKSKADFVLINGKAIVYEIKTELDTLDRLNSQLVDYYKAFSRVCVVTCESNYYSVLKKLKGTPVGVCVLTKKNTISTKKEPIENTSQLDRTVIFKILRKAEYECIIKNYYGELPQVSQFNYYSSCQRLFCNLDIDTVYQEFLKQLKNRNKIDVENYLNVPYELKFLIYFAKFKKKDYLNLNEFLLSRFGG